MASPPRSQTPSPYIHADDDRPTPPSPTSPHGSPFPYPSPAYSGRQLAGLLFPTHTGLYPHLTGEGRHVVAVAELLARLDAGRAADAVPDLAGLR
jgi:hypothetical protein